MSDELDVATLGRLKWRCRRGMLENDLLIERFFQRHEACLTARQASAIEQLMDLPDNELLDLLLSRVEPTGALDCPPVHEVLSLMRAGPETRPGEQCAR